VCSCRGAIYSAEVIDSNVMLTGDEDGVIKMWDMRRYDYIERR